MKTSHCAVQITCICVTVVFKLLFSQFCVSKCVFTRCPLSSISLSHFFLSAHFSVFSVSSQNFSDFFFVNIDYAAINILLPPKIGHLCSSNINVSFFEIFIFVIDTKFNHNFSFSNLL